MTILAFQAAEVAKVAPDWVYQLPTLNAVLNGLATILILWGFIAIKQGKRGAHIKLMLSAFAVSAAFLTTYLLYHGMLDYYTGSGSQKFQGEGFVRTIYLSILLTHIVLAIAIAVMVPLTVYRGLKADWDKHRRIAKVTFPIWLYVSITGVVIYFMLYHWG